MTYFSTPTNPYYREPQPQRRNPEEEIHPGGASREVWLAWYREDSKTARELALEALREQRETGDAQQDTTTNAAAEDADDRAVAYFTAMAETFVRVGRIPEALRAALAARRAAEGLIHLIVDTQAELTTPPDQSSGSQLELPTQIAIGAVVEVLPAQAAPVPFELNK